jgi:hypothetical protein
MRRIAMILMIIFVTSFILGACTEPAVAPVPELPTSPDPSPAAAPTLEAAEFELTSLEVMPGILAHGDEATATVQVSNVGEVDGCYTCTLEIADLTLQPKEVMIAAGETETVSFTFIPKKVGFQEVVVGDLTHTIEVRRPASFSIVPWAFIVLPNPAEPGSDVIVQVDVTNDGDIEGTDTVTLEVNGERVESKEVTIGPGSKKTVEFTPLVKDTPGEYHLRVNGETRTLMVIPMQEPPETGTYILREMTTGTNKITIENKLLSDAVVVLCKQNSTIPLIALYIRSMEKYTMSKIKRGTYVLYFTTGQCWDDDSKRFMIEPSYLRSPLEFECLSSASKYWIWWVELLPGAVPVTENEFPKLD